MAKKPKNNIFLLGLAAVLGLGIAILALMLFLNMIQTETYYVLKEDVPSRAVIDPEMLEPVVVSKGGAPATALTIADVQSGGVFAAHPLLAGDILTMSNVGGREDISVGVPDEWVITNFSVGADDAVGGRIQRGYYFDLLVADPNGGFYPFVNVLALDTTVSLSGASSADAVNTEEATAGQTTQYVVGMTPENAAKLHQIMATYSSSVKLVLSPRQNEYEKPRMSDYEGVFAYRPGDSPLNLGVGTDYTFTVLERDAFGRLAEELKNCGNGNAIIYDEATCADAPASSSTDTSTEEEQSTDGSTNGSESENGVPTEEETEGSGN